jgi:hypothetical protein
MKLSPTNGFQEAIHQPPKERQYYGLVDPSLMLAITLCICSVTETRADVTSIYWYIPNTNLNFKKTLLLFHSSQNFPINIRQFID